MDYLLYVKYAVAFLFVIIGFSFISWSVQKVADFLIALIMLSSVGLVCFALYQGSLSTWNDLIATSICAGLAAGILSIPLMPFSSYSVRSSKPKHLDKSDSSSVVDFTALDSQSQ